MFKYYQNLGFANPYYFVDGDKFVIKTKFEDIIQQYKHDKTIDPAAVIEVLNKNFPFGDRTVVKNISKTPWLAKPDENLTNWEFAPLPYHGNYKDDTNTIAKKFFELICEEILEYVDGKKSIGLLLSGGMDSRMVAGALDYLLKTNKIDVKITGLTWGNSNSRDVIYAKRIAEKLNWEWKHYFVKAEDVINNIWETGGRGCEYSPIHLHAIPTIKKENDLELILAGSYGDSIGRAEYGGIHVSKIPRIDENLINIGNLINNEIFESSLEFIKSDVDKYHSIYPTKENYMQNELDYQLHYMRRQLNPCMELLNEDSMFAQIFTSPNTFRYILNIDPSIRNDELYKRILTFFKTDLSEIPWARTGMKYGEINGTPDQFSNRHHSYVEILNYEILDNMKELVLSNTIKNLGIFNYASLEELFKLTKKYPINSFYYTEKLAWIASLSVLVKKYDVNKFGNNSEDSKQMARLTKKEYMPKFYRNKIGAVLRKFNLLK